MAIEEAAATREGILKSGWWCPGHSAADIANTCYETLANSVLPEAILCCTLSHEINRKRLNPPYCAAFSSHKLKFMQAVYFGRVSLDIGQIEAGELGPMYQSVSVLAVSVRNLP